MKRNFRNFLTAAGERNSLSLEAMAKLDLSAGEEGKPKQPTFEMLAYSGGILSIGWGGPVYVDLMGLKAADNIAILLDHNRSQLIGQGTAEVSEKKCTVRGTFTGDYEDPKSPAGMVTLHARRGFQWPCSIGASVEEIEEVGPKQTVKVNGRNVKGPAIVVRAAMLREVSFVSVGGDAKASAKIAASAANKETNMLTFEQWLKANGKEIADLEDAEKAKLQAAYDALKAAGMLEAKAKELPASAPKKTEVPPASGDAVAELRAEAARLAGAQKHLGKYPELLAKAIDEAWTVEKCQLQAELADLRDSRQKNVGNIIHAGGSDTEITPKICEAAMCLKHNIGVDGGGKTLIASYGEDTVNKADKIRRLRFSDMMRVLCARAGMALPIEVGSTEWIKAAFSASDIGATILGAVANKALAAVLGEPNWVAPRIAGVASHANFHTHTVYSLAVNGDLEEVSPTGELEHMDLGKESWTRQLKTRGARLSITRQDLINDDLGVFMRVAQTFARKALNGREKALFTLINATGAGSSHFTSARGNYLSGAAFGYAAIGNMIKAFRGLTGPDGDPILVEPEILLVTPTNEEAASRALAATGLLIATGLASTSSKTIEGSANIYAGRFGGRPVVSPYLENSALTGYSTTAFYLLANPAVVPCFEIAYLNGQVSPVIEYFGLDADPSVLGVSWRVYWDFGVSTAEWRAGVKHAGA